MTKIKGRWLLGLAFILHSPLFILQSRAQGIITTVAGSTWVFRGDGGPATQASLGELGGVTVDPAGNVFVADSGNNMVLKISPASVLIVVAGKGTSGFSGDGGPATQASLFLALFQPSGVAVDAAGNLFIPEAYNHRIRKVSPGGIITTVAGNGNEGFAGDGGPATSASLNFPVGVAVDAAGNLYIADWNNFRIRKVSPSGVITTVAGNGISGFSGDGGPAASASLANPYGVAVDGAGNLYLPDGNNHRIRKVSPGGVITTVAGNGIRGFSGDGGPATSASLAQPHGVAVDGAGSLYIADQGNNRIRKVSLDGVITTVAGNGIPRFTGDGGSATSASLAFPYGVALDAAGNLYIADTANHRIRQLSPSGIITTVAGNGSFSFSGDGGPATGAALHFPGGLAVDVAGNLYIADTNNERIRKVSINGVITTVAGNGIQGFSGDGGPATSASLNFPPSRIPAPGGVALDGAANLYIADTNNNRIRKVSPSGVITTVAGNGTIGPSGDCGPATSASLRSPMVWLWTRPATSTLPTRLTGASARSAPAGSLPPWPAMAVLASRAMAARPRAPP